MTILATIGAASSSFAGYTAQGSGGSGYVDTNANGPTVGDLYVLPAMALSFIGDTANDPTTGLTITPGYYLTIDATIDSVSSFGGTATGTYSIFFDQDGDGTNNQNLLASSGTASINANFVINGTFTPTAGPNSPLATDIDSRYNSNPMTFSYGGFVFGTAFDQGGALILRQTATATPPFRSPLRWPRSASVPWL